MVFFVTSGMHKKSSDASGKLSGDNSENEEEDSGIERHIGDNDDMQGGSPRQAVPLLVHDNHSLKAALINSGRHLYKISD